jgi:pilus assembly protein Flp/PilA
MAYPVIFWDDHLMGEQKNMLTLYYMIKNRLTEEEGQDLVEYALIIALIALACTAGLNGLATAIKAGFTSIGADV